MLSINDIRELISNMTYDINSNIKNCKKHLKVQSIQMITIDNKYDEEKCFLAIQTLLKVGINPNLKACFNYIFIQTALYTGYSEEFILNII